MQDCYPSKRATDQTKVLFHLSTPVGIVCTAKSFSKRVAVPATIPFVTPHKTNANLSGCNGYGARAGVRRAGGARTVQLSRSDWRHGHKKSTASNFYRKRVCRGGLAYEL